MSDRSEELRRQRDLLREHLAWVERELAAEDGKAVPALAPEAARPTHVHAPAPEAEQPAFVPEQEDPRDAEAILSDYRQPDKAIASQTKLGCVIYFIVGVSLLALAVYAFYLFSRASHPR